MSRGDYSRSHRLQLPVKKSTPPVKMSSPERRPSELMANSIFKTPHLENSPITALDAALFTFFMAAANKARCQQGKAQIQAFNI